MRLLQLPKILGTLLVCLALFLGGAALAQLSPVNSLTQKLKAHAQNDEIRLQLLIQLGQAYNQEQNSEATVHLQEAIAIAASLDDYRSQAIATGELARTFMLHGNEDEAERLFNQCINLGKDHSIVEAIAVGHKGLGGLYGNASIYDEAINHTQQALEAYTKLNDTENLAKCYLNLGIFISVHGNDKQVISYYQKAREYYARANSEYGLGKAYHSLASAHYNLGQFQKALGYLLQSVSHYERAGNNYEIFAQQGLQALCLNGAGKQAAADSLVKQYVKKLPTLDDPSLKAELLDAAANVMLGQRKYDEALKYADQLFAIAVQHSFLLYKTTSADIKTKAYAELGKYKEAVAAASKYRLYSDSLHTDQMQDRIQRLEAHYKLKVKNQEIRHLEQELTLSEQVLVKRTWALVIAVVLLLLFGVLLGLVVRYYIQIKKAREALEQSQQLLLVQNKELDALNMSKDRLFKIMAHDLRGPIGSLMHLPAIYENLFLTKDLGGIQEMNQVVFKTMKQLHQLLDSLLTWATAESGQLAINPERLKVAELVTSVENLLHETLNQKDLQLDVAVPQDLEIWADQNSLYTVLRNLVSNAIKFSFAGNSISVSARKDGDWVQLVVRDHGKGMADLVKTNLFSVSDNKKSVGTQGEKGTGLGLLIVKELLNLNNCQILVESTYQLGTRITIWIPARKDARENKRPAFVISELPADS